MTKRASRIEYTGGSNEAGSIVQRCGGPDASAEQRPVRIRAAVFFDGTLNNRTNVRLGQQGVFKGDSYRNYFSNIAILEKYHKPNCEYDFCFRVYVEGIGTSDENGDIAIAAALGIGPTGVLDKVETGVNKVISNVDEYIKDGSVIDCLDLDCFGFSRGAAAARNFVYRTLLDEETLKLRLESIGYIVNDVKVTFVGLFDTVASYGFNHNNDTAQLHLDAIKHAEYVIQVAAAEEHRKNFPLTNINSALQGQQLFLPGAHSDIGGGYVDNVDEMNLDLLNLNRRYGSTEADRSALAKERQWLLESGWYHEEEIEDTNDWSGLKATRRGISNHYSRIPLKMMAHHAKQRGVCFRDELLCDNEIPPFLQEVEQLLNISPKSSPDYWLNLNNVLMKRLRHDYLHFSAYYGSAMGCHDPYFTNDDPVRGSRKRRINNG